MLELCDAEAINKQGPGLPDRWHNNLPRTRCRVSHGTRNNARRAKTSNRLFPPRGASPSLQPLDDFGAVLRAAIVTPSESLTGRLTDAGAISMILWGKTSRLLVRIMASVGLFDASLTSPFELSSLATLRVNPDLQVPSSFGQITSSRVHRETTMGALERRRSILRRRALTACSPRYRVLRGYTDMFEVQAKCEVSPPMARLIRGA